VTAPTAPSRSVLVTGGNRGIGLATARRLAGAGHRVSVTCHASPPPDGLTAVKCDVADSASVTAAVTEVTERQGPVELLVCAAGITRDGLLLRMADDDLDAVLAVNLKGAVAATRAVLPAMARARWGRLLYVSSVVGLLGSAGQSGYAASKAALVGFARSVAREYAGRGVTANVVAPGFVATDMTAVLTEAQRDAIVGRTPLQRMGEADEVAAAVAYLGGEDAGFVTGAVLPVDGGLGMGH
jgi:NAD(P)-dependent dehydrogenase (short-subunit alcohol dehydrogenase family)